MTRRIAALTAAALLAAGAMTTAGAMTAAGASVASAAARPLVSAAAQGHRTANNTYSCADPWVLENSYDGGNGQYFYSRVGSPYQLLSNTAHTGYCPVPIADTNQLYVIYIDGTGNCLRVDSAADHSEVEAAPCNSDDGNQQINLIGVRTVSGNAWLEVQFWGTGEDCVAQAARDSAVKVAPCNPGLTGDVWILLGGA